MSDNQVIDFEAQRLVRRWTIGLKVCLALVIVPPMFGLVGTVLAMIRAFNTLGPSEADPALMAEAIGEALMSTSIGLQISFPAIILLIISIIGRLRAKRRLRSAE